MNNDRVRQLLVVASFLFAIILNGAANALPLNGQTTAEISDRFRVFVTPAGYVFAIWGLIYSGQMAFVAHTLRPSHRRDPLLRRIGLLPVAIGVLNGVWIILWHYEVFLATVPVMVGLLAALIVLYRRAGFDATARLGSGVSLGDRWLVQVPFSLYLGWITVATIANIAAVGSWAGVSTFGVPVELVAAGVLAVGLLIAIAVMIRTRDITYGAVIVWAYAGIAVKEAATPWVPWIACLSVAIVLALILRSVLRRAPLRPMAVG